MLRGKILLTILALLLNQIQAEAAKSEGVRCEKAFTVLYGEILPGFKHIKDNYTKEVPFISKVRDQGNIGTCHLQAFSAQLESLYALRNNGKKIEISTQYLSALRWYETTLNTLMDGSGLKPDYGVILLKETLELFQKYGIVPQEVWKPSTNFEVAERHHRAEHYAGNIIGRARLMAYQTHDQKEKQAIIQEAVDQVGEIFYQLIGEMPQEFNFEGKRYTPVSFAQEKFFEVYNVRYLSMHMSGERNRDVLAYSTNKQFVEMIINDFDAIERTMVQAIDHGIPVVIGYDHNPSFISSKNGVMSIGAFKRPENSEPLPMQVRSAVGFMGGHAVQIVGYEMDKKTGKVRKWKVLNSWGTKVGDQGFFHMYRDYFRAHIMQVFIPMFKGMNVPQPNKQPVVQPDLFGGEPELYLPN